MRNRALARVQERFLFLRSFLRDAHRTGSVTPSSQRLARALTAEMVHRNGSCRLLEVGAGTGGITREIIRRMRDGDTLDIYEMNPVFARHLQSRVIGERLNGRVRVFEEDIFVRPPQGKYDFIVCGLPLNNFPPEQVRAAFEVFFDSLAPDGCLSFFQYIFGRPVQGVFVGRAGRRRLREVGAIMRETLARHEVRRIPVIGNLPPALAHHLRLPR